MKWKRGITTFIVHIFHNNNTVPYGEFTGKIVDFLFCVLLRTHIISPNPFQFIIRVCVHAICLYITRSHEDDDDGFKTLKNIIII